MNENLYYELKEKITEDIKKLESIKELLYASYKGLYLFGVPVYYEDYHRGTEENRIKKVWATSSMEAKEIPGGNGFYYFDKAGGPIKIIREVPHFSDDGELLNPHPDDLKFPSTDNRGY